MLETSPSKPARANTQIIEAANRAEVTALLIRSGYRVYRPEADVDGEDLVLAKPTGELIKVQLKSRPYVDHHKYGNKNLWMLFPLEKFSPTALRQWFLIEHDVLLDWEMKDRATGWHGFRHYSTIPAKLRAFLEEKNCAIQSRNNEDPD